MGSLSKWKKKISTAAAVLALANSLDAQQTKKLTLEELARGHQYQAMSDREIVEDRMKRVKSIIPQTLKSEASSINNLVTLGKNYELGEERKVIYAPVSFIWFRNTGNQSLDGQFYSKWVPFEGRSMWDGSVEFFERQTLLMMQAGFNAYIMQVAHGFENERNNNFIAVKNLEKIENRLRTQESLKNIYSGSDFPKQDVRNLNNLLTIPMFEAASLGCYDCTKDFSNERVVNRLYGAMKEWFSAYLSVNDSKNLAVYNGKVLAYLWYIPGAFEAEKGVFEELNSRLKEDFGFECYWMAHYSWKNAGADEATGLFSGMEPFNRNAQGNIDLLAGWHPTDPERANTFLNRNGGLIFQAALNKSADLILSEASDKQVAIAIESLSELQESSFILPARNDSHYLADNHPKVLVTDPLAYKTCFDKPCHSVPSSDFLTDDKGPNAPFFYLRAVKDVSERLKSKLFLPVK